MPKTYFMIGTEPGVGTTFVSSALLYAADNMGLSTAAMQPISVGCEESPEGLRGHDALQLMQAMNVELDYARVNPFPLRAKSPPFVAATLEEKRLTVQRISGICRGTMMGKHDLMLVEGIGGWRTPINHVETMAGLAREINKPVILVVGIAETCVNMALLSAEAILRDGLGLAGWIANHPTPEIPHSALYVSQLERALPAPRLATMAYDDKADWRTAGRALDVSSWIR